METELRETIESEVIEYISERSSQFAIEEARAELRVHRLGRAWITPREKLQVETIYFVDKMLKKMLSATLEQSNNENYNWRRG